MEHHMVSRQIFLTILSLISFNQHWQSNKRHEVWLAHSSQNSIFGYFILSWFSWLDFWCFHEIHWLSRPTAMVTILLCFQNIQDVGRNRWFRQPGAKFWARIWWTENYMLFIKDFSLKYWSPFCNYSVIVIIVLGCCCLSHWRLNLYSTLLSTFSVLDSSEFTLILWLESSMF